MPQLKWGHMGALGCLQGDAHAISGRAVAPTGCPSNTPILMLVWTNLLLPCVSCPVPGSASSIVLVEECCRRSLCSRSSVPLSVGCAGNLCPSRVCHDLAGDKGCSDAFWGKTALLYPKGFKKNLYPFLTDAPLGFKSLWVLQGRMSCVGQEMWSGMELPSLC